MKTPWLFLIAFALIFYANGAGFIESFVNYPRWRWIGGTEFLRYHQFIGPRVIAFLVAPDSESPGALELSAQGMKSVFWLLRDSLAGRPGPHLERWSVDEFRAAGFTAVINLSEHAPDVEAFTAAGIEVSWVPLPTDIPPTKASEEQCVEALPRASAFVAAQISQGRRTLVHCYAGKDRTGMLMAVVLAKQEGLPARVAIQRVREVRPLAITAPGWEALALAVIPRVVAKLP